MNKIKFFMAKYINDIEDNINAFLNSNENINIEIINLYEVRKFDMSYCFCLVYKEESEKPLVEKL